MTQSPYSILILIPQLWPNAYAWYGVSLARALLDRGHSCRVVASAGSANLVAAREQNIPTNASLPLHRANDIGFMHCTAGLARLADLDRATHIVTTHAIGGLMGAVAMRLFGLRCILIRFRGDPKPPRSTWLNRWVYQQAKKHVLPAECLRSALIQLSIPGDQISTIPPAVKPQPPAAAPTITAFRRALGLAADQTLLSVVARLDPVKGHQSLFLAIRSLIDRGRGLHLLVVGPDARLERQAMIRLAKSIGIEKSITVIGFHPDLSLVMGASDIGVIASIGSETISRVLLNWMALGKPVVGTRVGAIPEIIRHDQNGLLAEPNHPASLAQQLDRLLTDTTLRTRLSQAALQDIPQRFSLDRFTDAWEELLSNTTEASRGHGTPPIS